MNTSEKLTEAAKNVNLHAFFFFRKEAQTYRQYCVGMRMQLIARMTQELKQQNGNLKSFNACEKEIFLAWN